MAIATQKNICDGKFRVTHGGPTFRAWPNWKPLALRSYEYICGRVDFDFRILKKS